MKESTQGAGAEGSFMDEYVAVVVADAVAVAVTEAVAEADQSIHDQSIHCLLYTSPSPRDRG